MMMVMLVKHESIEEENGENSDACPGNPCRLLHTATVCHAYSAKEIDDSIEM